MCIVALFAVGGYRNQGFLYPFVLALTMVLALDPLSPLGLGFWFSFLCVGLLLVMAWQGIGQRSVWSAFLLVQVVLLIGLAPVNAYFGLPFSLSNALANLMVIPWVSLFVLPGVLITTALSFVSTDIARGVYVLINEVLHLMINFLSSLQSVSVQLKSETELFLVLALFVVLAGVLLLFRIKGLLMCLTLSLMLYFWLPSRFGFEDNRLIVFDSGQGLAILIQTENQTWLYDTGAAFERSSVAENTILPYLRSQNIAGPIEGIVVSHGDWDHAGGIKFLLSELTPRQVWSGETDRLNSSYPMSTCIRGMSWNSDATSIEVLYPKAIVSGDSSNNRSCVLRVKIQNVTFLLMGDLEDEGEKRFLVQNKQNIKADILIAGHHGSNNATSFALLKRVRPKAVVFSSGYRNRFGHPHPKVIERAKVFGADIYNTSKDGALLFSPSEFDSWQVTTMRNSSAPFWLSRDTGNNKQ